MKKTRNSRRLGAILLALCLFTVTCLSVSAAQDRSGYHNVDQAYTELNDFRLSQEAWYFTKGNRSVKDLRGKLKPLKRNAELEQAARTRAKELSQYFGHTRPNGKKCFTVYPQASMRGENIAKGQETAKEVTQDWKEHYRWDTYETQGHCRNMLSPDYTDVGIAHYTDSHGVHYWVQAFAKL